MHSGAVFRCRLRGFEFKTFGGPTVLQLEPNRPLAEADRCTKHSFRLATSRRQFLGVTSSSTSNPESIATEQLEFGDDHDILATGSERGESVNPPRVSRVAAVYQCSPPKPMTQDVFRFVLAPKRALIIRKNKGEFGFVHHDRHFPARQVRDVVDSRLLNDRRAAGVGADAFSFQSPTISSADAAGGGVTCVREGASRTAANASRARPRTTKRKHLSITVPAVSVPTTR
jgi:hypothetical protein